MRVVTCSEACRRIRRLELIPHRPPRLRVEHEMRKCKRRAIRFARPAAPTPGSAPPCPGGSPSAHGGCLTARGVADGEMDGRRRGACNGSSCVPMGSHSGHLQGFMPGPQASEGCPVRPQTRHEGDRGAGVASDEQESDAYRLTENSRREEERGPVGVRPPRWCSRRGRDFLERYRNSSARLLAQPRGP